MNPATTGTCYVLHERPLNGPLRKRYITDRFPTRLHAFARLPLRAARFKEQVKDHDASRAIDRLLSYLARGGSSSDSSCLEVLNFAPITALQTPGVLRVVPIRTSNAFGL